MLTRRHFLISCSAGLCAPYLYFAEEEKTRLRAGGLATLNLLPNQKPTPLWGFNGSTPGSAIWRRQGGRVKIQFENALDQSSAIHWHGVRINNKMDGVPGLTQAAVSAVNHFLYDFVVSDAGTYWYQFS